jgi:putative redox protein
MSSRIREAHFVHEGPSRFTGTTGSGRSVTFGDLVPAGELSPVEMVVASLATCSAMDVASIAAKKRQAVTRYEVHVQADQRDEFPQVLTEATVTHEFWGTDLSEAAIRRSIELSATKYCPVNAMVSAGATTVHHRYSIHSTGAEPYEHAGEVLATGPYHRPDVVA